jgi:hypothetical protein
MRRILAISMAAAIPAVLPVHAADARTKPAPPPAASAHSRTAPRGGHSAHGVHGRPAHTPVGEGNNEPNGKPNPANDVQVSADDGGNEDSHGAPAAHGAPEAPSAHDAQQGAHAAKHGKTTPRTRTHGNTQARPGTGADTGFSDSQSDMAMPAEAAEAIRDYGSLLGAKGPAGADEDKSNNVSSHRMARIGDTAVGATQLTLRTMAGPASRTVVLRCDPPGGTHPNAAEACAEVAKTNGDLKQLPASTNPRACFMIYAPVTVSAQGNYHGQAMRFSAQFPNTCVMRDKTGSIFDF